jgi:hypothetical protein
MSTLPELSAKAEPEFTDPARCKAWLEHLPLANVATAQNQLLEQIEEFNRFPTDAANRLAVMETLREAVNFVQIEQAKRFTNRALPMAQAESKVFDDTIALWEQMRLGYLRCVESAAKGEAGMRTQAPLICQRALAYAGLRMFHHHRAYRQVPAQDWSALHAIYAAAERMKVADSAVKDFLNRDVHDTSPRIAYARAVLMAMCNPNELNQRQLTFAAFLLERWASKLDVSSTPVAEAEGVPPLAVDLAGDSCPERLAAPAAAGLKEPRYFDLSKISKSLRNRVGLLRKGESPSKLALGEDCVQPSCEQLLVFLYRQWCQPKAGRSERKAAGLTAEATSELPAIHYYLSGRAFRQQQGESKELSQKQRDEIATFGRVSTRDEDDYSVAQGFTLELWELVDESAQGLQILRRADVPGRRYTHGQLMIVRHARAKSFLLGQIRWLMAAQNGDLNAGIRLLPGLPAATAVRPTGLNVVQEEYVQAVSLTAVKALNSPPSLVLPVGWYKPNRIIEVFVESSIRVKLVELVERGSDFERVAYEAAP